MLYNTKVIIEKDSAIVVNYFNNYSMFLGQELVVKVPGNILKYHDFTNDKIFDTKYKKIFGDFDSSYYFEGSCENFILMSSTHRLTYVVLEIQEFKGIENVKKFIEESIFTFKNNLSIYQLDEV